MTYQLKDYLYSINQSKKNILDDDIDAERGYPPYIINRCLSSFTDTVLYSNEMNKNPHLSKKMQYDFASHFNNSEGTIFHLCTLQGKCKSLVHFTWQ